MRDRYNSTTSSYTKKQRSLSMNAEFPNRIDPTYHRSISVSQKRRDIKTRRSDDSVWDKKRDKKSHMSRCQMATLSVTITLLLCTIVLLLMASSMLGRPGNSQNLVPRSPVPRNIPVPVVESKTFTLATLNIASYKYDSEDDTFSSAKFIGTELAALPQGEPDVVFVQEAGMITGIKFHYDHENKTPKRSEDYHKLESPSRWAQLPHYALHHFTPRDANALATYVHREDNPLIFGKKKGRVKVFNANIEDYDKEKQSEEYECEFKNSATVTPLKLGRGNEIKVANMLLKINETPQCSNKFKRMIEKMKSITSVRLQVEFVKKIKLDLLKKVVEANAGIIVGDFDTNRNKSNRKLFEDFDDSVRAAWNGCAQTYLKQKGYESARVKGKYRTSYYGGVTDYIFYRSSLIKLKSVELIDLLEKYEDGKNVITDPFWEKIPTDHNGLVAKFEFR